MWDRRAKYTNQVKGKEKESTGINGEPARGKPKGDEMICGFIFGRKTDLKGKFAQNNTRRSIMGRKSLRERTNTCQLGATTGYSPTAGIFRNTRRAILLAFVFLFFLFFVVTAFCFFVFFFSSVRF
ncbi:hypothetical protein CH063_08687 [Colletotrichum higginsianum]|uniref:Transmembrane protein n=1 Tax=Colletotrichum higginsianum (strain IMI 349063) TaxID=759273 RepID=H1VAS1_COLHI|nr:hypothetical protein CH063_08687 [Colletotrichum higginsianum]